MTLELGRSDMDARARRNLRLDKLHARLPEAPSTELE